MYVADYPTASIYVPGARRRADTDVKVSSNCCLEQQRRAKMNLPSFLHEQADAVVLSIKLQPRAAANEVLGVFGNELRVKVTAPPVDAAANDALVRLLADKLDCPRNRVELVRGHTSRHKVVRILGMKAETLLSKLQRAA